MKRFLFEITFETISSAFERKLCHLYLYNYHHHLLLIEIICLFNIQQILRFIFYFLEILQKVYKSQMNFEMSNFCTNELNFTYFLKFSYRFLLFYKMKMDLERIGGRHRDNSHHFAAESEALDQIAKEVRFINNVYYYPDCQ